MRVTQQMITDRSTANLSSAMDRLLRLQTQMSSGRRLQQPSDDLTGVTRALAYRQTLVNLDQYQSNVDRGKSGLSTVEQGPASANTLLVSAREKVTSLANDNYDATARQSAALSAINTRLAASVSASVGRLLGPLTKGRVEKPSGYPT
ncbi:MAG: hypothetical protein HY304_07230 [candidate division Zixibacteria bacterium]|nr:hypothetical protein [candidate division Zixibacteria bacterium]